MFYASILDEKTEATYVNLEDVPTEARNRVSLVIVTDDYAEDDSRSVVYVIGPEDMMGSDLDDTIEYRWWMMIETVEALNARWKAGSGK